MRHCERYNLCLSSGGVSLSPLFSVCMYSLKCWWTADLPSLAPRVKDAPSGGSTCGGPRAEKESGYLVN